MNGFTGERRDLVLGRLTVYRCWKLPTAGTVRLMATGHEVVWDPVMTAECLRDILAPQHPAPQRDCGCGLYGWYHPDDFHLVPAAVFGAIEVWGNVVLGDHGVRAQHARVLGICQFTGTGRDELAAWCTDNAIPTFDSPRLLVEAHPPADLSALGVTAVPALRNLHPHRETRLSITARYLAMPPVSTRSSARLLEKARRRLQWARRLNIGLAGVCTGSAVWLCLAGRLGLAAGEAALVGANLTVYRWTAGTMARLQR